MKNPHDKVSPGKTFRDSSQTLRDRAEEKFRTLAYLQTEDMGAEETKRLLHELRVHQIELEMQNEELRRAYVELDVTRARYFDLYDLAPVGYVTITEKGLLIEANLTAATLLLAARSELVQQPLSHFIHAEDQDIYYLFLRRLFGTHSESAGQTDALQGCELRMVKKDGTEFWVRLAGANSQNADNAPFYRIVISDITQRKQAEEERFELENRLQQVQKAKSLSRMAGAIAHHFNNQLTAVMGYLEMFMKDLSRDDTSLEKLARAMTAARKAADMSSLMLTYLGQTTATKEPIDISEVCRRSLTLLRAAMPRTIRVEGESPYPGPIIHGNANQIQQVLTNLIINAGEACEDRGSVHLTVKTVSGESIRGLHRHPIDWQPQEIPYACLEVSDVGCGIADEDIEKIFDPFFTSKFSGRGLGLPVVLGVLRAHHGAITVESRPGRGSIFRVFLPVSAEALVHPPGKAAKAHEMARSGTVLLVEDEEIVRSTTATMLTSLGFTVLEAKDGVEAVAVFRKYTDDIRWVLCDLTMPRMDGWETLGALRNLSPGFPLILYSGHDRGQVMNDDHPEWPNAFLHKPFSMKELADAIQDEK